MTTPTPSTRPAALVAMAAAAREVILADTYEGSLPEAIIAAALKAASDMGFVLIPRAELEEAAEALNPVVVYGSVEAVWRNPDLANRLRQRSRG